jgi:hypothetical protein
MARSQDNKRCRPEVLLEVMPTSRTGDLAPRVAAPEEFTKRAGEIADTIAEVAEHFRARLARILERRDDPGWQADSIEIAFDIAVHAEAGVVIARTGADATFSAKLILKAPEEKQ